MSAPSSPSTADVRPTLVGRLTGFVRGSVIARFASVGVVNTLVDFVIYVVLFAVGVPVVVANAISTTAGMAVSFVGNRRFVFGRTDDRRREILLFVVVCGLGIWVIQPVMILLVGEALSRTLDLPDVVVGATAKGVAILVAAVWNYFLYSRLVFRGGAVEKDRGDRDESGAH
ncbi:GtrA family protein [Oerskovia jenensis]|uniref:GtrA family protein n=1 Tax=Oerskovia jenensis TaxID=162169 RepID=UPI0036D77C27